MTPPMKAAGSGPVRRRSVFANRTGPAEDVARHASPFMAALAMVDRRQARGLHGAHVVGADSPDCAASAIAPMNVGPWSGLSANAWHETISGPRSSLNTPNPR